MLLKKLKDLGIHISAEQVTEKLLTSKFNNMSKVFEYLALLTVANDRQPGEVKDLRGQASRVVKVECLSNDSSKISRD